VSTSCYSFVPVTTSPERGATIRVSLDEPVDVRLGALTANEIVLLRGELIQLDTGSLAMSATWLRGRSTQEFAAAGETVTVPRRSLSQIAEKRFSPLKSALFGGAIIAAALLIQGAFHPFGGGGSDGGGGVIE
jgi:hypothetical protein